MLLRFVQSVRRSVVDGSSFRTGGSAPHVAQQSGVRWEDHLFLYGSPKEEEDDGIACLTCPQKESCCPRAQHGRRVTLPFDTAPHIDAHDPPMAKRFRAMMTHRPAVERVIKRLKCDFSEPHLSKRGNAAFEARLNKTMIAFHLLLRA